MDKIFDWCVELMKVAAPQLSMTYKELNVWLFVIIHPLITLLLILLLIIYISKYYRAKKKLKVFQEGALYTQKISEE